MKQTLASLLSSKRLIKAIAGIDNFDAKRVAMVAEAVEQAGTPAIDIAACPDLLALTKSKTNALVFVSSVAPKALVQAAEQGADVLELGNFDALYAKGIYLNGDDVWQLAKDTMSQLDKAGLTTPLCVTIPGHLSTSSQVNLARQLETLGVALLQTEGASRLLSEEPQLAELSREEQVQITLNNTKVLSAACSLPVMTASGLTPDTVASAIQTGGSAVGLGRCVNQSATVAEMVSTLEAAAEALSLPEAHTAIVA